MQGLGGAYLSKLDRYELKYIVPSSLIEPISEFLMTYCDLDYHSKSQKTHFYTVNSLYFDTPNLTFATNRLYTRSPRFNMRGRVYNDGTMPPYFLEIKVKDGNVVNKYRAKVDDQEWPSMFTDLNYRTNMQGDTGEMKNKNLFYTTAMKYDATPRIYTQYKRRAFVSKVDEYVRVTMDIDMKCYLEDQFNLVADVDKLVNYDSELVYAKEPNRTTESSVVLELKCYPHQVPLWLLDLIRTFELTRTSFSKYLASLQTAIRYDSQYGQFYNFNDRAHKIFKS